jgi:hypothetical protein
MRRIKLPEVIKPFYFNANDCNLTNGVLYLQFTQQSFTQDITQEPITQQSLTQPINWADEF